MQKDRKMRKDKRILIVDDDEDLSLIMAELSEDHGYSAAIAKSGEEAFTQLSKSAWYLIFRARRCTNFLKRS